MNAETTVTVAADPPDIRVAIHPDALRQIILNLLKNAAEALPPGGKVKIEQRETINRDGSFYAEVVVADNGPGIPPPLFIRLFSQGTTSKSGDHRGLGLSIAHGLVKAAGGEIDCRTDRSGTRFHLLLPLSDNAQVSARLLAAASAS